MIHSIINHDNSGPDSVPLRYDNNDDDDDEEDTQCTRMPSD
jgi:hypothetical protein